MGIIARQGIKTSIINFIGAFIGMLSVLFIYPLEKEVIGFASNLYSMSFFISPFIGIGVAAITIKYYHKLPTNDANASGGFLLILLSYIFINLFLFVLFGNCVKDFIYGFLNSLNFDSSIFAKNETVIIGIAALLVIISLFTAFSQIHGRNAIPSLITNFCYKLFLPTVVVFIYLNFINKSDIDILILLFHIVAVIVLGLYIAQFKVFSFNLNDAKKILGQKKEMLFFGLYSGLTSLGSILAFRIDSIMISGFLGYGATGSYVLPMTMAAVLDIPNQALIGITGPIVSKAWVEKDLNHLKVIYQKGSMNLMIAGIFILLMGSFCFDDLTKLSSNPTAFEGVKWVFILLCLAKLTDMATSVNSSIIGYSDFYRFNLYFVIILGVLNISLNFLLIPLYGIIGAAWATFISLAIFNLIKFILIYIKFNLNPFTKDTIKLFILGLILFGVTLWLDDFGSNALLSLLFKSIVLFVTYAVIVFKLRLSIDLNRQIEKYFKLIFNKDL